MLDLLGDKRWQLCHGDCVEVMAEVNEPFADLVVYSPPFPSLFAYTDEMCDLGNCNDLKNDARLQFECFFAQMAKVLKPGRVMMVHCMQIPAMLREGRLSTFDFRGMLIQLGMEAGFIYDTDWPVTKNPQAQAIRTHSTKLLFVTVERDRTISSPSFQDHLIKFRAPGENDTPINDGDVSRNEWIDWAEGVWDWQVIRETDTLNTKEAKGEKDTKHICPLQLGVIERLVRMYSMPCEVVFSPFAGIGSEGYVALKLGRRFIGVELKDAYYAVAENNLRKAEILEHEHLSLFEV